MPVNSVQAKSRKNGLCNGNENDPRDAHKVLICQGMAQFKTCDEIVNEVLNVAGGMYDQHEDVQKRPLSAEHHGWKLPQRRTKK